MKLVAIDIETTGTNENVCQILEFGAIAWELGKGRISSFCRRLTHKIFIGEAFALHMNAELIRDIGERKPFTGGTYCSVDVLWLAFDKWLTEIGLTDRITVTGKNFGSFDSRFIRKLPNVNPDRWYHRILDPGSLYFEPETDKVPPNTDLCIQRAELNPGDYIRHSTLGDCALVLDMLEAYYVLPR